MVHSYCSLVGWLVGYSKQPDAKARELVVERYLFRPLTLEGEFLHEDEIHLYPRYHRSESGYHILTPFRLNDGYLWQSERHG